MDLEIEKIKSVLDRVSMNVFNMKFKVRVERDNEQPENGRIFLQIVFEAPCANNRETKEWHGCKEYLSKHMTNDELIKRAYKAFKAAVDHEVMEAFKVDNITLFNPHVDFEELLKISHKEVKRDEKLLGYRRSGKYDINGVEIIEGSIINADGYKSNLEKANFHCVMYEDGMFGSDIYGDFDVLSMYKTIEIIGHCSDYKERFQTESGWWSGNLGSVIKLDK